jgi:hypothetical protein
VARPRIDLRQRIKDILTHVEPLPKEAETPLPHYWRSGMDTWNLLDYIESNLGRLSLLKAALERHLTRLRAMMLVSLIENFERFLKEIAAACVDHLAHFVLDDRFNEFKIQGSALAVHFGTETLGKSLCESSLWLDCDEVNGRFRKLLADPFGPGTFYLFPKSGQQPALEQWRYETLSLVWQIRHSVVHNVGVITQSDAIKLRLLTKQPVESPRTLAPTRYDLRYLKRFLDETAELCNRRVAERLAELLTTIHASDPGLFDPDTVANEISRTFGIALTVAGVLGAVPPPV